MSRVSALVKAAHPGPCAAVTLVGVALAATAGAPAATCGLIGAALLSGQLSIGWANDAVDHRRDLAANRRDKPVARGLVSPRAVWRAALVAAVLCVPLSLALGIAAGIVHLVAVAGGWAYDLGLKRTIWSAVPFAVSFGLLPAVVTLALPEPITPPWWATAAGALLGVAAHLANALPDLDDDVAAGVLGLPQRLGRRRTRVIAGMTLAAAAVVLTVGPGGPLGAAGAALLVATAALLAAAFGRSWPERSRAPFALTLVAAVTVVGLLLARGAALS